MFIAFLKYIKQPGEHDCIPRESKTTAIRDNLSSAVIQAGSNAPPLCTSSFAEPPNWSPSLSSRMSHVAPSYWRQCRDPNLSSYPSAYSTSCFHHMLGHPVLCMLLAVTPMCCSGPYHRLYHCSAKFGVPAARDSVTEWSICTHPLSTATFAPCLSTCLQHGDPLVLVEHNKPENDKFYLPICLSCIT
ncbi:hypothetical protein B0H14DRAFT_2562317 [Mycena olivaceomarginata]|nr:hypothetical protein B0H14DRAFT_2562317 [Mycena olivaceomarginata]